MEKRRMCPHCRAFVTVDDRICPYCDGPLGERAIDRRNPPDLLGGLIPQARYLTILILTLNAGLYAATMILSLNRGNPHGLTDIDTGTLLLFGAKSGYTIANGQYWRLITAGFLHGGIFHFLMNTWVLFDLGANAEESFGSSRMAVIYFTGTICGFLLSYWWSPVPSVGSSAGIFGLIGAMIAYGSQHRTFMGQMIKSHYSRWAIYGLLIGLLPIFPIDNAAHLGGLAGGFAVAWLAGRLGLKYDRLWDAAALGAAALTALAFARVLIGLLRLS